MVMGLVRLSYYSANPNELIHLIGGSIWRDFDAMHCYCLYYLQIDYADARAYRSRQRHCSLHVQLAYAISSHSVDHRCRCLCLTMNYCAWDFVMWLPADPKWKWKLKLEILCISKTFENVCARYLRRLKLGVPFRDGVFGALRPPWIPPDELLFMAPRSILPSIKFRRRKTSANVERKHTISSCCVSTRRSKSCTRPAKPDFSDSSISSANCRKMKRKLENRRNSLYSLQSNAVTNLRKNSKIRNKKTNITI